MKLTIDTNTIKDRGVSVECLLYTLSVYFQVPITHKAIEEAAQNSFVGYDSYSKESGPVNPRLTKFGKDLVEDIFFKSDAKTKGEPYEQYIDMAKAMQECYPSGYKKTDDGRSYPWRDSVGVIARKIWTLKKKNPHLGDFTIEEAVEATKNFVASFSEQKYMPTLKYFILCERDKEDVKSPFMAYLEAREKPKTINKDWTTETR